MTKQKDKKQKNIFWRVLTRFGQLPLLMLVVIFIAYMAANVGDIESLLRNAILWRENPPMKTGISWIEITIILLFTLFCSYFFGSLIKYFFFKERPNPQLYTNRLEKIDAGSFPSIHTANSLICAFWGSVVVWGIMKPTGKYSMIAIGILLVFWLLFYILISYSRVILKKHYWIDLFGGSIFGAMMIVFGWYVSGYIVTFVRSILHYIF